MRRATLEVPDGQLYYEVRGTGPVLLMIPGGPMDTGGFEPLAEQMASDHTVVTFDCRGNSRSTHSGDKKDLTVELLADDACRLLEAVTSDPALVLGSSGGATYGLDLVARHPGRVSTLVAHEPPVASVLPDADTWREFNLSIGETYEKEGIFPAMQRFGEGVGLGGAPAEQDMSPEGVEAMSRMMNNLELFASHLIPVVGIYEPDIDALRNTATRIVIGVGSDSTPNQVVTYQAPRVLAEKAGLELVTFPGDHGGFAGAPEAFAAVLRSALVARARGSAAPATT